METKWKEFSSEFGDSISLINVFKGFKKSGESKEWCHENYFHFRALRMAINIYHQLIEIMEKNKIQIYSDESSQYLNTRKCYAQGTFLTFFSKLSLLTDGGSLNDNEKIGYFLKSSKKCMNNSYLTLGHGKSPKMCFIALNSTLRFIQSIFLKI